MSDLQAMKPTRKRVAAARLRQLIPDLEYSRETHVQWRDCGPKHRERNPDIGSSRFHAKYVRVYDERIAAINEAISVLEEK